MKGYSGAGAVLSEPRAGQRAQMAQGWTFGPIFSQSNNTQLKAIKIMVSYRVGPIWRAFVHDYAVS